MRVYLDNVLVSGRVLGDLPEDEMQALDELERAHKKGRIKMVTSRETWREQERTKDDETRALLKDARDELSVVQSDHKVLGMNEVRGPRGTIAVSPLVTDIPDEALFADLRGLGLDEGDAKHLMYAVINDCVRFATLDHDFFDLRPALEARCQSLTIVKPSDLASELSPS